MAYETKALLTAIYSLAKVSKNVEEVCQHIKNIANVEGVILTDNEPIQNIADNLDRANGD